MRERRKLPPEGRTAAEPYSSNIGKHEFFEVSPEAVLKVSIGPRIESYGAHEIEQKHHFLAVAGP